MNFDNLMVAVPPQIIQWFSEHGVRVALILSAAVVIDALVRGSLARNSFGGQRLGKGLKRRIKEKVNSAQYKRIKTIANALGGAASFAIFVIAAVMIMPEFGVNAAPIIAGLGLAGLAVSMAAKDILTDFVAGLFIFTEEQFNIGDKVAISGIEGVVKEITLRRTVIESADGATHLIPNREIKVVTRRG